MKKHKKIIFILAIVMVLFTITSIVITAIKGNPTEAVRKVIIESDNYDNPGSYHIEKSAKWITSDEALINFDVDTMYKSDGRYKDVILVIDMSGSMVDLRLATAKKNAKELVDVLLDDNHNSVSLITFDTSSEILSGFTNNKELIINEINDLNYRGATNYNAAFNNVIEVLDGYEEKDNTDLVVLFLTDGYPNEDTPNQIGTYQILKSMYPYITVHGVQYEMGSQVVGDVRSISDQQWIADTNTLHNVLFDAVLSPLKYEKFEIVDYIDKDYFDINSINDIDVSMGSVNIEEEDGYKKVIWNIDSFYTGNNASMKIKVKLKDEYTSVKGLYSTNDREVITSKIVDNNKNVKESDKTPVLKNYYKVIYDTNAPTGCTLDDIEEEEHIIYTNVTKKQDKLTCNGYLFKGWKIEDNDVVRVNDDTFIMPQHDVTIKAIWSKVEISKSMDGKVYEKTTLYKAVENEALNGSQAKLYDGETDDGGGVDNVYYYTGSSVANNNVLFGDFCWQIVRTTDTGGVKMIYNGYPDESGKCGSDRGSDNNEGIQSKTSIRLNNNYLYGSNYIYNKNTKTFELSGEIDSYLWSNDTYETLIGKYTCQSSNNSCNKLYYVDSYNDYRNAYVIPLTNDNNYQIAGINRYNTVKQSLSDVGYMYNTIYEQASSGLTSNYKLISSSTLNTEFFYSDSYIIEAGKYKLVNPQRINSTNNYSNMVGMYTFRDSSSDEYKNTYLYYIVAVDGSNMYYLQLSDENDLNSTNYNIVIGDEIRNNNDGTYTLIGNTYNVLLSEWYSDYNNYINKYICYNNSLTCDNAYYMYSTSKTGYRYENVSKNYKYGKTFEYDEDNNMYILKDTKQFYDITSNYNLLSNYHYTCLNNTGECQDISYVYYSSGTGIYYITFNGGKGIDNVIKEMLSDENVNKTSSSIKLFVDNWYKLNMVQYSNYLEDIVFCNDRNISSLGGWNLNGDDIESNLEFGQYQVTENLKCPNLLDSFSVSSDIGNGSLIYPVGLLTASEAKMMGESRYASVSYWLMTPSHFNANVHYAHVYRNSFGQISAYWVSEQSNNELKKQGVRPVISLKPNTEYTEGDGSEDKPFVVPTD